MITTDAVSGVPAVRSMIMLKICSMQASQDYVRLCEIMWDSLGLCDVAHTRMLGTGVGLRSPDGGRPPEQDPGSRTAGASPTQACAIIVQCVWSQGRSVPIDHVSKEALLRHML